MTAQLQHGIERFRRRAVSRGWRAGCPATPETGPAGPPASAPRQPIVAVDCADRQAGGIGQPPAASSASCDSCLAPRPIGRGSLGRGRGAIAAGWWSWHPSLISRDASRVQWGWGRHLPRLSEATRARRRTRPRSGRRLVSTSRAFGAWRVVTAGLKDASRRLCRSPSALLDPGRAAARAVLAAGTKERPFRPNQGTSWSGKAKRAAVGGRIVGLPSCQARQRTRAQALPRIRMAWG